MKKTKLIASCLAVGIFAISASVQADSRATNRVTATPLGETFDRTNQNTRATGGELIWASDADGASFFPQDFDTAEEQANNSVAEDMTFAPGAARELSSYMAQVHQRSSEGDPGFTAFLSILPDDGAGPDNQPSTTTPIAGSACSIPDMHGLGRPDEAMAVCVPASPAGDTGIILPDRAWMSVSMVGGCAGLTPPADCTAGVDSLGPGWLLGPGSADGGDPSVGSTDPTFAFCIIDADLCGNVGGFGGGNTFLGTVNAGVPAPVPTVSEWGMVLIAMLVLTGGTIVLRRSRNSVATA